MMRAVPAYNISGNSAVTPRSMHTMYMAPGRVRKAWNTDTDIAHGNKLACTSPYISWCDDAPRSSSPYMSAHNKVVRHKDGRDAMFLGWALRFVYSVLDIDNIEICRACCNTLSISRNARCSDGQKSLASKPCEQCVRNGEVACPCHDHRRQSPTNPVGD